MSVVFRVRLPRDLAEQLTQVCESARMPTSGAIRACVQYVLNHPEAWEVFQHVSPYSLVDTRSPQAIARYAEYESQMEDFDMDAVARKLGYT